MLCQVQRWYEGLGDDQSNIACARIPGDIWVANYNVPE